jgi:alanyl-tRNA synthetase
MNSADIRIKFFEFFKKNNHEVVASSSLIPAQDPTLLFTNAGMNQFKDLFLGNEKRSYQRAVSIQKCMRAGGKHNDLDNVGFTKRHLTFFEMMGNFSFGDYFKKEAIAFAWNFLTKEIGLPAENLYATVFEKDDEAFNLWCEHLPLERVSRLGAADNFWQMGDTGPCGPCTEIYIDRGLEHGCQKISCAPGCSCDRFLEIWNLVFMQFNRQSDGTDVPLKQTGVDTGMGLERLCAVVQGKDSVYETDLFQDIIKEIERLTGVSYAQQTGVHKAAFHVIADHIRSSTMLLADGCSPSNDGRGYVLRKIIRRAALFEQKLTQQSIFPELSQAVVQFMGDVYPELKTSATFIKQVLKSEIDKFAANLVRGTQILEKYFVANQESKVITGEQAFKLYDTFGFPFELIQIIGHERGFAVDHDSFEFEMNRQREQSGKKAGLVQQIIELDEHIKTTFVGYDQLETKSSVIVLVHNGVHVDFVPAEAECILVTQETPFFVACGGQVDDTGIVVIDGKETPVLALVKLNNGNALGVIIKTSVPVHTGSIIISRVNDVVRINTMKNHTATHLLQAALIELLGKQVKQSGSVVTPDYLRFDFTHHENLTQEQIKWVEDRVNQKIRENIAVSVTNTTYKDAIGKGVIAIFGEKYNPESVRVIDVPGFSAELCGGTHVQRTGDIGCFKITEVGALSAGNRRIVALTGPKAIDLFQDCFNILKHFSQEFKVKIENVREVIERQHELVRDQHNELKKLRKQLWRDQLDQLLAHTQEINEVPFMYAAFDGVEVSDLRDIAQSMLQKKAGFYFVVTHDEYKTSFVASVSQLYASKINLKELSIWLKAHAGLTGGGSATIIQGGGALIDSSDVQSIKAHIVSMLKATE